MALFWTTFKHQNGHHSVVDEIFVRNVFRLVSRLEELTRLRGIIASMHVAPRDELIAKFSRLIGRRDCNEHSLQRFIECHPEFLPTPFLLNHQLHAKAIISQFRIDTTAIADFAYLTKSSVEWRLVLVELEPPSIQLFRGAPALLNTADFSRRIDQMSEWRDIVARSADEIADRLLPLTRPLARNRMKFRYHLIIGRSPKGKTDQKFNDRIATLNETGLRISTYDTLFRHYVGGHGTVKNVLSMRKGAFALRQLNVDPEYMFQYMTRSELLLTKEQERIVSKWGYDLDAWNGGLEKRPRTRVKRNLATLRQQVLAQHSLRGSSGSSAPSFRE